MTKEIDFYFDFISPYTYLAYKKIQTLSKNIKELSKILVRADLAKFAKSKPFDTENEESMRIAKKFIKQTTEIKNDE